MNRSRHAGRLAPRAPARGVAAGGGSAAERAASGSPTRVSAFTRERSTAAERLSARRYAGWLVPALSVTAALALLGVMAASLWSARSNYLEAGYTTTRNLARVLEEQTARSFQAADATLASISTLWSRLPDHQQPGSAVMQEILVEKLTTIGPSGQLCIIDRDGMVAHDTSRFPAKARDLSTWSSFQWHRENPSGLHVGTPMVDEVSGRIFITASRRLSTTDGSFAGIVVAILDPRRFESQYSGLDIGAHGLINLRHWDGSLLARVPHVPSAIGRRIASTESMRRQLERSDGASGELVSSIDGINRLYTIRRVAQMPLLVFVGLDRSEVLAPWQRSVWAYGIVGALVAAAILWLTWRLSRELRQRDALMAATARSEALIGQVLDTLPVGVSVADRQGSIFMNNPEAARIWGTFAHEQPVVLRGWTRPGGIPLASSDWALARARATGRAVANQMLDIEAADGTRRTILDGAVPIRDTGGEITGAIGVIEDITGQRELLDALAAAETRYRALFESSIDAVLLTRPEGHILSANPEACRLLGYDEDELRALEPYAFVTSDSPDLPRLSEERARVGRVACELTLMRKDGTTFPVEVTSVLFRDATGDPKASVIMRDITARKSAEARIHHLAYHDELTGLPNRALFNRTLATMLARGGREPNRFAVMLVDLDGFKHINDTLGHEYGDQILREVGARLRRCVRDSDIVARLGGDEFVMLVADLVTPEDAGTIGRKMLHAIAEPCHLAGQALVVTASAGISVFPRDGADQQTLMKNADLAMYRAKDRGKNNFEFHAEDMNLHSRQRLKLEAALRRALERDELRLWYQPKISLSTREVTGVEALLRWHHPEAGLLAPADFVTIAEDIGLIVPIGDWVLRAATSQHRAWLDAGLEPRRTAVNLSARQLVRPGLPDLVVAALREAGLDGRCLEIEVTESMVMRDPEHVADVLRQLRALGIRITVDDFGTGYSSLSYLKRFPIDCVKIDGAFIRDVPDDPDNVAITRGIVAMAHGLQLGVIAEGVENSEQIRFLEQLGCDEVQGFAFSAPLPPAEAATRLPKGR
ncbi:MAG: EAL domain-containing protein [Burkholderiales bacterium]